MKKNSQLVLAAIVLFLGMAVTTNAVPYTASLADDFAIGSNSNTDTWSYRLDNWQQATPTRFDNLFPVNIRTANDLWGTSFASPPTMWGEASGFNGIGKNTTGVDQTSGNIIWRNGTVLLHPDTAGNGNGDPLRHVISWLAPSAMTIDVSWNFQMAEGLNPIIGGTNGVGLEMNTWIGGVAAQPVPFNAVLTSSGPIVGALNGLSVAAGDRLYWTLENWGPTNNDMTLASITITGEIVPEPSSLLLFGLGGVGLVALKRRRK